MIGEEVARRYKSLLRSASGRLLLAAAFRRTLAPGGLRRIFALHEGVDALPADLKRQIPHCIAALQAGLGQFRKLISNTFGERACTLGVLQSGSGRDQRSSNDLGDDGVLGERLQGFPGLASALGS